jgi:hypothetical protein
MRDGSPNYELHELHMTVWFVEEKLRPCYIAKSGSPIGAFCFMTLFIPDISREIISAFLCMGKWSRPFMCLQRWIIRCPLPGAVWLNSRKYTLSQCHEIHLLPMYLPAIVYCWAGMISESPPSWIDITPTLNNFPQAVPSSVLQSVNARHGDYLLPV